MIRILFFVKEDLISGRYNEQICKWIKDNRNEIKGSEEKKRETLRHVFLLLNGYRKLKIVQPWVYNV